MLFYDGREIGVGLTMIFGYEFSVIYDPMWRGGGWWWLLILGKNDLL